MPMSLKGAVLSGMESLAPGSRMLVDREPWLLASRIFRMLHMVGLD